MVFSRAGNDDVKWRRILYLIVVASLIRGLCHVTQVPPWQSPDEVVHFEYIRHLSRFGIQSLGVPAPDPEVAREVRQSMADFSFHEISPDTGFSASAIGRLPLYYATAFALVRASGLTTLLGQFYLCRLISMLFGLGAILMTFLAARLVFPRSMALTLSTVLLVSLVPQFTYINASVSPDAMTNFLYSLFAFLAVRTAVSGQSWPLLMASAITIFLAIFTKRAALVLLPAWLFSMLISIWKDQSTALKRCALAVLLFLATSIACLMAVRLFFPQAYLEIVHPAGELLSIRTLAPHKGWFKFHQHIFVTFWAAFGWLRFPVSGAWHYLMTIMTVTSVAGLISLLWSWRKEGLLPGLPEKRALLALFGLLAVTYLSVYVGYGLHIRMHAQGRYLFPAMVPIGIFLSLGLSRIPVPRSLGGALPASLLLLFLLDMVSIFYYIFPSFHFLFPP